MQHLRTWHFNGTYDSIMMEHVGTDVSGEGRAEHPLWQAEGPTFDPQHLQ